jgi:hypothetical protein
MMKRRIILLAGVLLAAHAAGSAAQNPPPRAPLRDQAEKTYTQRRLETLLTGISLSSQQRTSVDSILAYYAARVPATPPESVPDSTTRSRMVLMLQQMDAGVRAVLTAEQQRTWDRNLEAWRNAQRRPAD